jgi:hypothetical protein
MRSKLAALAAVATLCFGLAGCSDDGGEDADRDDEVTEALADVMGRNLTTDNGEIAAQCTAESIVDDIGGDRVVEAGLLTEDLEIPSEPENFYPEDVAEAVANAYVECWDVDAQVEDVEAAIPRKTTSARKAIRPPRERLNRSETPINATAVM